ncbi:MAG: MarR family transcriptional regulator [Thermoplasmata archaeon]|nr:MarR family transcriptional regulator [Thermoplasmata archaeon]
MMAESGRMPEGFSSPKQRTLLFLKRSPGASLAEVAGELGVSKVAALRHLASLEAEGLVERSYQRNGVGRPRVHFRLGRGSSRLFPQAYTQMSICALQFIEGKLGRDAVVTLLKQRTREVEVERRGQMRSPELSARVTELVKIRQEGGYMAEVGARRRGSHELLEHNCPVLAIAERFPEACEVERKMFESLLRARVETSHRVVAGDPVCRFVIRPQAERA